MVTEFVPIVIGWFGEFGPAFQGFIDRVGSHFGDRSGGSEKEMQFAAKWRARRFAASVVLFQIVYTTSVVVRMVGIDGRALARDYSLRPVLG